MNLPEVSTSMFRRRLWGVIREREEPALDFSINLQGDVGCSFEEFLVCF